MVCVIVDKHVGWLEWLINKGVMRYWHVIRGVGVLKISDYDIGRFISKMVYCSLGRVRWLEEC